MQVFEKSPLEIIQEDSLIVSKRKSNIESLKDIQFRAEEQRRRIKKRKHSKAGQMHISDLWDTKLYSKLQGSTKLRDLERRRIKMASRTKCLIQKKTSNLSSKTPLTVRLISPPNPSTRPPSPSRKRVLSRFASRPASTEIIDNFLNRDPPMMINSFLSPANASRGAKVSFARTDGFLSQKGRRREDYSALLSSLINNCNKLQNEKIIKRRPKTTKMTLFDAMRIKRTLMIRRGEKVD